ncbi:MAG: DUF1566 domain-containing protein [Polyangia bacterium]
MNATNKLRSIAVAMGAMLVSVASCGGQSPDCTGCDQAPFDEPCDTDPTGSDPTGSDSDSDDSYHTEDAYWVGEPCEPVTEEGQADPCIEISGGNQDAFCLAREGAPGGICTRECTPATYGNPVDGCVGHGVVCKDVALLTADASDDEEGYGVCLEECVVDMGGNECKADYIACNPRAWSFESMFATCLLPKCVSDADCPVPVGTLCDEDVDCDATAGEHCSGGICVFEGVCDPQSGLCSWNGDPDAEIGDPCQTTRDCPDDCECKTPTVDEHGKTVAANGYCLKRGCTAANELAPNGSGSSTPGAEERFGCGVVGTCYAGFHGGGACLRRCGPHHQQDAFKCRQGSWDGVVEDVNGDYDCYDLTALGFFIPTSGNTEMYPVVYAPVCAWVANSFQAKCNSPDYDAMTSTDCKDFYGGSFDLDMTCRNATTGEPDESGYCLDETTSGPSETWDPNDPRPPMEPCQGGRLDPFTGLCWQNPPSETAINWYEAGGAADPEHNPGGAVDYCKELELGGSTDWRLPDIDELISLLRGCVGGEVTGDLTASCCPMDDPNCLDEQSCWEEQSCGGCAPQSGGPGEAGSYQDESLSGTGWLWSASSSELSGLAWGVDFDSAVVGKEDKAQAYSVRCVRQAL